MLSLDLMVGRGGFKLAGLALAGSMLLNGCGGGGSDSAPFTPQQPSTVPTTSVSGTATGVFTDAPVGGLSYTALPSGATGVTNSAGEFKYNPGDRITFTFAGLELGVAEGAANVTPANLSGNADVVNNLLVLLQSLDTDSSPDTITLSSNPGAMNLSGLDLSLAPTDFVDPKKNIVLAAALPPGNSIVLSDAAKQHAIDYFWSQAEGMWRVPPVGVESEAFLRVRYTDHDNNAATPRVAEYLVGDLGEPADGACPGTEVGVLTWDPLTMRVTAAVTADNNDDCGFSGNHPNRLAFDGDKLRFEETLSPTDTYSAQFSRVENDAAGLVGAWALVRGEAESDMKTSIFVFSSDNGYVMLDPLGDTDTGPGDPSCGGPGVEDGIFSYAGGVLSVMTIKQDTNACAGLHDTDTGAFSSLSLALSQGGALLTATEGGEVVATFKRVSK